MMMAYQTSRMLLETFHAHLHGPFKAESYIFSQVNPSNEVSLLNRQQVASRMNSVLLCTQSLNLTYPSKPNYNYDACHMSCQNQLNQISKTYLTTRSVQKHSKRERTPERTSDQTRPYILISSNCTFKSSEVIRQSESCSLAMLF